MLPSTGTVGDSYDNAMAESADGAYKTELVWRRRPFADLKDLELATFRWVSWRGLEASAPVLGLQDTGTDRNRVLCKPSGASRPTIRAEQKSGHITGLIPVLPPTLLPAPSTSSKSSLGRGRQPQALRERQKKGVSKKLTPSQHFNIPKEN